MTLACLAVCFDALVAASLQGVLDKEGRKKRIREGSELLIRGLKEGTEADLIAGSLMAGELLRRTREGPIQSIARCLAPLYPLATYSQLTALLFRCYLIALTHQQQSGNVYCNEAVVSEFAQILCGSEVMNPGLMQMAEWVWAWGDQGGVKGLKQCVEGGGRESVKVLEQVLNVLRLFEVDGGGALEEEVVRDVLEVAMG